jgi:hypothetical protein
VPVKVFAVKGIPSNQRDRIEAAVVAAGKHISMPHEAWIAADPLRGGFKVLITGPHGLERSVAFVMDEESAVITAHIRAAVED